MEERRQVVAMLTAFLRNPHYRSGGVISKLGVNWATLVWAVIILSKPDALEPTAYGWVGEYIDEDWIAWPLFFVSALQVLWLWCGWKPLRWGHTGYALLTAFWAFVLCLIVFSSGPAQPTSIACVSTVVALAAFAFSTLPKRGCDVAPK
jgi:hypothetical protein